MRSDRTSMSEIHTLSSSFPFMRSRLSNKASSTEAAMPHGERRLGLTPCCGEVGPCGDRRPLPGAGAPKGCAAAAMGIAPAASAEQPPTAGVPKPKRVCVLPVPSWPCASTQELYPLSSPSQHGSPISLLTIACEAYWLSSGSSDQKTRSSWKDFVVAPADPGTGSSVRESDADAASRVVRNGAWTEMALPCTETARTAPTSSSRCRNGRTRAATFTASDCVVPSLGAMLRRRADRG
mmetsp:Transcript_112180/g.324086  ORF Transcript_112180/g.324086 Transcript_112180/m.324086 type:complete len:237 (+) Transcript_112180:737-1447(+)